MPVSDAPARPEAVAVILAAGKSTRMKSATPKPLHPLCGIPLAAHVIRACRVAGVGRIIVIVGHAADRVRAGLGDAVEYVLQENPRGTGHAVRCAADALAGVEGDVLVLAGDVPLLKAETLASLRGARADAGASVALLEGWAADAGRYGRVLHGPDGAVTGIVEARDASAEQLAVHEWNASVYCFRGPDLLEALPRIDCRNDQNEYYLTDAVGILHGWGRKAVSVRVDDESEVLGVNTCVELAAVTCALRKSIAERHMLAGVSMPDPGSVSIDVDVEIGADTLIEPQAQLRGRTAVGAGCLIGAGCRIEESEIGDGARILASHITQSRVGPDVTVGPYAHIRPGCDIGAGARIGSFCELKLAAVGPGAKLAHLTYLGDADVGAEANIGGGTITCNYDGWVKRRTEIGPGAFVGSNNTLVAPIRVGAGAYTAAGSTLTEDVPDDALGLARSRQAVKPGWAQRLRDQKGDRAK